ncbi:RidA family protein [Streptomyces sp. BE133]|uniref:RidA family protein n=1 Tax=Streptomyces sp. BE133 TaxID=3002523 RepID=UPI002E769123|nr:RidA family protein [Streptomyces sp. BE133]MEE1805414.1 RidA family protein [Streptomyces sp. BE133]
MEKNRKVTAAFALVSAMAFAGLASGVQADAAEQAPPEGKTAARVTAEHPVQPASTADGQDKRRKLGDPWKFDGRTALYQTSEVRDPRGILFVAGQTAKEGNAYLYAWDMEKQIDQVEKYVKDAGYQPNQITQLRYSVTDEDLFFKHFDKVIDRLDKAGIKTTSAAIGVERLAQPGVLLEIEAVAVR